MLQLHAQNVIQGEAVFKSTANMQLIRS